MITFGVVFIEWLCRTLVLSYIRRHYSKTNTNRKFHINLALGPPPPMGYTICFVSIALEILLFFSLRGREIEVLTGIIGINPLILVASLALFTGLLIVIASILIVNLYWVETKERFEISFIIERTYDKHIHEHSEEQRRLDMSTATLPRIIIPMFGALSFCCAVVSTLFILNPYSVV